MLRTSHVKGYFRKTYTQGFYILFAGNTLFTKRRLTADE